MKSAKHGPVEVSHAPESTCPSPPEYPDEIPAPAETNAPVEVEVSGELVSLKTDGARTGTVLARLAEATDASIVGHGTGTAVPLYADVTDRPLEVVLAWIARATGLEIVKRDSGTT